MKPAEFQRLRSFDAANKRRIILGLNRPAPGRRLIKGRAKGVGQWLKDSRVKSEVRLLEE